MFPGQGNCVRHALGLIFRIEARAEDLEAALIQVEEPAKMPEDFVTRLTELATTAYLDLFGWLELERPRSKIEGRSPKPN